MDSHDLDETVKYLSKKTRNVTGAFRYDKISKWLWPTIGWGAAAFLGVRLIYNMKGNAKSTYTSADMPFIRDSISK